MLIPCPHCGPRDASEFTYFGDATVARPALDASAEAWAKAVYDRANPRGRHQEWWQHAEGCRCFIKVARDTVTHDVLDAVVAPLPDGPAS